MVRAGSLRAPSAALEAGGPAPQAEDGSEVTSLETRVLSGHFLERKAYPCAYVVYSFIMNAMAQQQKTLAIEVGIGCSNSCLFCYQQGYRALQGYPRWMTTEELRSRILWGLANGYDELSLTGGEPTIRPDFLDLVRFAREAGYRRVAVTTNGWMLANPEFFAAAVAAGLTSVGVSIHGPDAQTHERLTQRPGSFRRAIETVRNAVKTHGTPRPVRLNTFTLVNRLNYNRLVETAHLLFGLGVRLMVFQPVILSKANFDEAAKLMLGLKDTVASIREVAKEGVRLGFRTKLYNLPPCLFREVLQGIETDHYERRTFREHDKASPEDKSLGEEPGHVRFEACFQCVLAKSCYGLPVSLTPQNDLVQAYEEVLERRDPEPVQGRLWIVGLDMVGATGIYRVVRKARLCGFREIVVTHGGAAVAGKNFFRACAEAGAFEVVLVHHSRDHRSSDRILAADGNDRFVKNVVPELVEEAKRSGLLPGLLVSPCDSALKLLSSRELEVFVEKYPRLHLRAWEQRVGRGKHDVMAFVKGVRELPYRVECIVLEGASSESPLNVIAAAVGPIFRSRGLLRFSWIGEVVRTPFCSDKHAVLNWSEPRFSEEKRDFDSLPLSRTLRPRPLRPEDLRKAPYIAREVIL